LILPPLLDDLVVLMKLISVSCTFDAGRKCEVKIATHKSDTEHGITGQLYLQMSPEQAIHLMSGDEHAVHIKRV
jgi:hypothetical protein